MLTIKDLSFDKEVDRPALSVIRGGRIKLDLDAKEKYGILQSFTSVETGHQ